MKIIEPSYYILVDPVSTSESDICRYIERIGRICYKSEDKITDDSAIKFVNMLKNNQHWAMLEHYIFRIKLPISLVHQINDLKSIENPDIQEVMNYIRIITRLDREDDNCGLIIASPTGINKLNKVIIDEYFAKDRLPSQRFTVDIVSVIIFIKAMHKLYPNLINDVTSNDIISEILVKQTDVSANELIDHNSIVILDDIDINNMINTYNRCGDWRRNIGMQLMEFATWFSVKFTVNRGVTHELVRHRPASYAQESTRYCNYSGNKFGSEITVISPLYYSDGTKVEPISPMYTKWKQGCEHCEKTYFELIELGATAQMARGNLPTDLKADIVCTASLHEWLHIFDMRCDSPAHPQIREVMIPLYKHICNLYSITCDVDLSVYHPTNVVPYTTNIN